MRRPARRTDAELTDVQRVFVAAYLQNGYKAGPAYRASHPRCGVPSSWTLGSHLLRNVKVAAAIKVHKEARFKALQMAVDEVLSRIAIAARADIRDAYDETGKLLPVHMWPDSLRLAVKSVEPKDYGQKVKLQDGLRAAELLAKHHKLLSEDVVVSGRLSLLDVLTADAAAPR